MTCLKVRFFFGVVFISFWSTSAHIYFELFFFSGCERCKGVRSEALSNGVEMTIRSISKEAKYSVTGRPHDRFWETLTAGVVFDILVICIAFIICLQI